MDQDQYEHPIEDQHLIDDVIKEFNSNKIEYISSVPNMNADIYNSQLF